MTLARAAAVAFPMFSAYTFLVQAGRFPFLDAAGISAGIPGIQPTVMNDAGAMAPCAARA